METVQTATHRPAVVILTAILNFLWAGLSFLGCVIWGIALLFGNVWGMADAVTRGLERYSATRLDVVLTVNVVFGVLLVMSFAATMFSLALGVGLLRANGLAWYFQIAASLIGLVFFPLGTVVNALILVFLFQPKTRAYFRI